ncbi:acyltransferase family protein [Aestuariivivens sediminicola]|uniref:acyltransferase family protein n=1 Tax=Aestuariivivens sediminicola TaxID=2913560 RepID=UPI001F56D72A|nr:DUF5009 domain-containing protein [Aestuariivivens sediminicola]
MEIKQRLLSLDAFRGLTMFLLTAEAARLYSAFGNFNPDGFLELLLGQFHHHPWHGLRFWDLIQPFFMFIVGVAMPFSYLSRLKKGQTQNQILKHIVKRCIILLFLGVLLHCIHSKAVVWELWNVLSQLSVTILIAFFLMRFSLTKQLIASLSLVLITDLLYRFFPLEGFNNPWVMGQNFGSWMDMVLMGKINSDGWVAINAIPSAAHTIWGVMAGQILLNSWENKKKLNYLITAGIIFLMLGYALDFTGISLIIKRICSMAFIFASGGWALLVLSLFFWLVDIKNIKNWTVYFVLFGTNPIFIYYFSLTIGEQWFNEVIYIFTSASLGNILSEHWVLLCNALAVLGLESLLLLWMYRNKILIKI